MKTPQEEYSEAKADAKKQYRDGLISEKEMQEQISWAYLEMRRRLEVE